MRPLIIALALGWILIVNSVYAEGTDYFPLAVGNTWVYECSQYCYPPCATDENGTLYSKIIDAEIMNDSMIYTFFDSLGRGTNTVYTRYYKRHYIITG